jgi:hypothetical protein
MLILDNLVVGFVIPSFSAYLSYFLLDTGSREEISGELEACNLSNKMSGRYCLLCCCAV